MPLSIVFTNPGNYTIEDDGIRGNNISVIRDGSGVVITTFVHPSDTLTFSTIVPGVNLTFNVGDSFGSANVNVGQLGDLAASPESIVIRTMRTDAFMTLVSRTTIIEGGKDASADVIAAAIVLSAPNGIGTPTNALETQTTFIEAEVDNGGINIANFGLVQIGGITPDVDGLDVTTSGNLNFSTVGSMFLSDTSGPSTVHGGDISGNVTLTAIGEDADIYAPINYPSIYAAGGGITLNAGRNVWFGPGGMDFNNDIWATGDIRITAGGDFLLDGASDVRTGAFGGVVGGDIIITAGRNIDLDDTTGGHQTISAFAGDIILTTGAGAGAFAGGAFVENAAFPGAITTTNNIILNSDTVLIASGGLNTSGIGSVTIRPVTPGLQIDLGNTGVDSPGAIGLSDAEFDLLFTLNVIIGSDDTGNVIFSQPLSPFIVDNLTVHSGNDILFNSTLSLPRALTLYAGDDLAFSPTASFTSTIEGFTAFVDNAQDDDNLGGIGSLDGTFSVATDIRLNGNLDADTLRGSAADDMLMGNAGNDQLRSFGGADLLNGGLGRDYMEGGLGDDTYVVDNALDVVFEAPIEGFDTVQSSLTYTLGSDVEKLVLTGTANLNGTGNGLDNVLLGNVGDNLLNGGIGADEMRGGAGDDTYIVDTYAGDTAVESSSNGTDEVQSSVTFVLGGHVEALTLTGAGSINGTGNGLANVLRGNTGNNLLNGSTAGDEMRGGAGNDVYVVDNAGDTVVEGSGNGNDRVESAITYSLGANVEDLTLTGTGSINGTGNGLDNTLRGNDGNNQLNGAAGADEMRGGAGNDTYIVDNVGDQAIEANGNGTDTVNSSVSFAIAVYSENLNLTGAAAIDGTGNKLDNIINGNGAANTLSGGLGDDTLNGGLGNDELHGGTGDDELSGGIGVDSFRFDTALSAATNVDDILDFLVADDTIHLDRLIFTGIAVDGPLSAAAFRAGTAATDADDRIVYDAATGNIFYDSDGVGAAAQILFATVDAGTALTRLDFVAYTG